MKTNLFEYLNLTGFEKKLDYCLKLFNSNDFKTIDCLIEYILNNDTSFIKNINHSSAKPRTVAVITKRASKTGIARVCCDLCNKLIKLGFKVVYIIEMNFASDDFFIEKGVIRESLCNAKNRNYSLINIIKKHKIDSVIHNESAGAGNISNDLVIFKILKVRSYIFLHMSFSCIYIDRGINFLYDFIKQLSICDGLIVTNKLDYEVYKPFCNKTYLTYHSIDYIANHSLTEGSESNNIIWISRGTDPIKRINDIIYICQELKKKTTDFKILIVGDVPCNFAESIKLNKLEKFIEILGFQNNIFNLLNDSLVYLSTSSSESFGLSIAESFFLSKPVIMYNLSYLPFVKSKGVFIADIGNYEQIAKCIYALISNHRLAKQMGKENNKFIKNLYMKCDLDNFWIDVLNDSTICSNKKMWLDYVFERKENIKLYESAVNKSTYVKFAKMKKIIKKYLKIKKF